jgi:NAD(P)-dependent dehydrogenase (short-subunit alcohol dehydrogenase family)
MPIAEVKRNRFDDEYYTMTAALNFSGKTIVITGSTRGIGFGYAKYLASLGANLLINGVSQYNVDAATASFQGSPGKILGLALPVSQGEEIIDFALQAFSRVDAVINNAGIVRDAQFSNMTVDEWNDVYRVHLEAAFRISKAIWPHYLEKGGGKILMTSSSAGIFGNFGQANYSAMKAGIIGLTKTLAIEGKKHKIWVNAICPAAHTDMNDALMKPELKGHMGAEKVSPVAAYLCHEACSDSGSVIEAGAGWIAKVSHQYSEVTAEAHQDFGIDTVQSLWPELNDVKKSRLTYPTKISDIFKAVAAHIQG